MTKHMAAVAGFAALATVFAAPAAALAVPGHEGSLIALGATGTVRLHQG